MRTCLCGCGASLEGMRADAKYASSPCRAKATKLRQQELPAGYDPEALGRAYRGAVRGRRPIPFTA